MPRFAHMLRDAYEERGHHVRLWAPRARVFNRVAGTRLAKWGGYIDQYLLFPQWVRRALAAEPADTLFVFCDQALGPWVPLVSKRAHVVHCHDLLALRSALGDIPQNPTSWSGRLYQRYIRRGFQKARNFISISGKTRSDLQRYGKITPLISEVVYNGLNYPYAPLAPDLARDILRQAGLPFDERGMLLSVGGSQWYKNRPAMLRLYAHYARAVTQPLPLWCVGPAPDAAMQAELALLPDGASVRFFQGLDNRVLQAAYSLAAYFLFPSLAEGFGWPLVEAQACGCPVLTSDDAPMNEVAGPVATYLPLLPAGGDLDAWAAAGALALRARLDQGAAERAAQSAGAQAWAAGFSASGAIDNYLAIYRRILAQPATVQDTPS